MERVTSLVAEAKKASELSEEVEEFDLDGKTRECLIRLLLEHLAQHPDSTVERSLLGFEQSKVPGLSSG